MIFSSKAFMIFLPIVLMIYHRLSTRGRKYTFLLGASWLFYSWWSFRYLWIIILCTAIDYCAARWIEDARTPRAKKRWLMLSIVANLALLGLFKYTAFVVSNSLALARICGYSVPDIVINIVLPLGISFHTFQGISYTIDVYRGQVRAVRSFRDYALFVAFFPQLVAGPIVRASEFLPQMTTPPSVTSQQVIDGMHWFLVGLFKKLVIADSLAIYVGEVFAHPELFDSATHRWAAVAWMLQIYCDFSGYSDMAVGCAKWFGFELPRNFNFPFLATSVTDFWRRWHLSLSTWLRDYFYYPIGGSRGSQVRTCFNLFFLFLICGIWHGATWGWICYGMIHGALMVVHRLWSQATKDIDWAMKLRGSAPWRFCAWFATFWMVVASVLIVRAESWSGCWMLMRSHFCGTAIGTHHVPTWVPFLIALVALGHLWSGMRNRVCALIEMPAAIRATAYVMAVFALIVFHPGLTKPFIYFAF
ncbi:MAG: MBOAT family protein [Planctomycetes bacterium]|nr:MBOAT family protein [Planctomycetota bacterium]